ncbi:MAG: family hydrolase [Moraxellaceae bacterium]|jgi:phosphoglycolate phosphatase-like HAD superfamily hydrolase|nr:family hydrolase [Moraxellaceae bacterium]
MKRIRRIFLDLDGTLLEGRERHYQCYRNILEQAGFTPIGIDAYWDMKRAMTNRRELLALSGAEELYDRFLATWLATIESPEMLALDRVHDGAVSTLQQWKQQGLELVLITMRQDAKALDGQLERLGLQPLLDAVLVCSHIEGGAGKAEAIRRRFPDMALSRDSLWIGDTEADWTAARALGIDVVLVTNGLRTREYLDTLEGALVVPAIEPGILARACAGDAH